MKRFYSQATIAPHDSGWQVLLDGRALRTAGGALQVAPTPALAELLAAEWRAQDEQIDPRSFPFRDMADYAIDVVQGDRAATIAKVLTYGESDTLCYRAEPDAPLFQRQQDLWEPLVTGCETRLRVRFHRISGVLHQPQPPATLTTLRGELEKIDAFPLAGLVNLASLAASLITALAALEPGADAATLFTAANAEEDWQAELWGWEWTAEELRATRAEAFRLSLEFVRAAAQANRD